MRRKYLILPFITHLRKIK